MKKKISFVLICKIFLACMIVNQTGWAAQGLSVKLPFAFQDKFSEGVQHLGYPEGRVLQVGCFIDKGGESVTEVSVKNLDSGVSLKASSVYVGEIWSGLYQVFPHPKFEPDKHLGEWELSIMDVSGNKTVIKTHKLNIEQEMPYIDVGGIKATGNPLAPLVTWSPPNMEAVHEDCKVRYEVRLATDIDHQIHRSKTLDQPEYQIPAGVLGGADLDKMYIRVDTQGYDKTDKEHSLPLEQKSQTFILLKDALAKQ